jgi:hypothetical protein
MKRINGLSAAVAVVVMVASASAFADSRPRNESWRGEDRGRNEARRGYRDNERVTMQGTVRSFSRERDGYRVELDRGGYSYFVPERYVRNRRDFRVGISIQLGGVFRGGSIYVDSCNFPGAGGGYHDSYDYGYDRNVSGVVERIDFRRDTLVIRDQRTGRFVTVDMRRADRRSRSVDLNDLRRGDYVELSGEWVRGGVFAAHRVDSVSSGRGRYGRRY